MRKDDTSDVLDLRGCGDPAKGLPASRSKVNFASRIVRGDGMGGKAVNGLPAVGSLSEAF
jgi:hypothetical protein